MKNTMLKAALFALLGSVSAAALADGVTGFYVQGDIGLSNLRAKTELKDFNSAKDLKNSYKESSLLPRVSIGHDFGNFRVAGDYTHYKKADSAAGPVKSETKTQGIGVSAMYEIPLASVVQPYVGARLAVNKVKQDTSAPGMSSKTSETKLSPGLMAGVGYQVDRNISVDAGYRYNHFDNKLKSHEATVGLRYTFR